MRSKIKCCHKCTKRYLKCHSSCPDYKKERGELDEFNAEQKKEAVANYLENRRMRIQEGQITGGFTYNHSMSYS